MATINPDDLGKAVGEVLQTFSHSCETTVDEVAQLVGKETAKQLKGTSPVNPRGRHSGRYAKGWTVKKTRKGEVYVYNKTDYQLTHLLEKGHRIVAYGKDTGKRTRPNPHISIAEEYARTQFLDVLSQRLKYQH